MPAGDGALWDNQAFRHKVTAVEIELKALEMTQLRVVAADRDHGEQAEPGFLDPEDQGQRRYSRRRRSWRWRWPGRSHWPITTAEQDIPEGKNDLPDGFDWADTAAPEYFNYRKVSIYGGSNEIQRNIIAKMVLGF